MDESTVRTAFQRYLDKAVEGQDNSDEIYHDDAGLEFPQSQERFEGRTNFMAWRKIYPSALTFKIRRIRGQANFWVAEISLRYGEGPWNYGCSILEFRGEKVARETIYFGEAWEAPQWRASWRAGWQDESLG